MAALADRGIAPSVVDDQFGRLTFTAELGPGDRHLLDVGRAVRHLQRDQRRPGHLVVRHRQAGLRAVRARAPADVTPITTEEYAAGKQLAPRPANSLLDLTKLESTGFRPEDALTALARYLSA